MNRLFIVISAISILILFSFGNLYACDTGTCQYEANHEATVIAQQQGLQGGFAVFDSAWCEFDYCSSDWALYSGDQNDPNSNIQFLEIFPCQSWSDFCYSGSGGGGGAGEGNDDGTCYIRFNADCPIECRICIRIPAPAY